MILGGEGALAAFLGLLRRLGRFVTTLRLGAALTEPFGHYINPPPPRR